MFWVRDTDLCAGWRPRGGCRWIEGGLAVMPLYEYVCRECAAEFELRLSYEQRLAAQRCPECGSRSTLLRISAAALVGAGTRSGGARGGGGGGGAGGCGHASAN